MSTCVLFVYGTLKRGGVNHGLLRDQRFLREAVTLPRYRLYDLGPYPCLVEDDQGVAVEGELWEIETALLPALDELEGAPDLFRRQPIDMAGEIGPVIGYLYQRDVSGLPDAGRCWPCRPLSS